MTFFHVPGHGERSPRHAGILETGESTRRACRNAFACREARERGPSLPVTKDQLSRFARQLSRFARNASSRRTESHGHHLLHPGTMPGVEEARPRRDPGPYVGVRGSASGRYRVRSEGGALRLFAGRSSCRTGRRGGPEKASPAVAYHRRQVESVHHPDTRRFSRFWRGRGVPSAVRSPTKRRRVRFVR